MTDRPEHDHRIEHEPHLAPGPAAPDPSEAATDRALAREALGADRYEAVARHSVFNEPAAVAVDPSTRVIDRDWTCLSCNYNLRGMPIGQPCPECGQIPNYQPPPPGTTSYGTWLTKKIASTSPWTTRSTVLFAAVAGGVWAVVGAMLTASFGIWGITVVGPITEEVMKVAIVAGTIETHPYLFRSRAQIWFATLASAAVFATIENLMYLNFYIPDPTANLALWRWTVCTALHVGCTAVATVGVVRVWQTSISELREPRLGPAGPTVMIAAILHGSYNSLALLAAAAGFEF